MKRTEHANIFMAKLENKGSELEQQLKFSNL